jgi:hypothetical protein
MRLLSHRLLKKESKIRRGKIYEVFRLALRGALIQEELGYWLGDNIVSGPSPYIEK